MITNKVLFHLLIICLFIYINAPPAILSYDLLLLPDIGMIRSCKIDKIYQLGDSTSDTGNRMIEDPLDGCSKLPYGQSFFRGPTGRCSDGMLIIDYIALAAGLPLLNPYLKGNANFSHGVNFAVTGSTVLSAEALAEKSITVTDTRSSLEVQLEWMSAYFSLECNGDLHCSRGSLKNALFMVGETGINDYNYALGQGKTIEEAQNMVPDVVKTIKKAIRRVIDLGAAQVIVPGIFPVGCFPVSLMIYKSNNKSAYDEHQCLKEVNDFAAFHNKYLQGAIVTLQEEYPATIIVYADYFSAFKWLLYNAPHLGIDATSTLKGCCGDGGTSGCVDAGYGRSDVSVCSNPNQYISWDGLHLTQKADSVLAKWLVADIVPKLNCGLQVVDS